MDKNRPYHGRKKTARRRRSYTAADCQTGTSPGAVKLYVCIGLFLAAVLVKVLFPATFAGIGDKINTVVNYKAAFATLGEGISGQKKFTSALGEAFTYAFTGQGTDTPGDDETVPDASAAPDGDNTPVSADEADKAAAVSEQPGQSFADAVAAAFMQDQSEFSDYNIPAGVTYGIPSILYDYAAPIDGVVSSAFGYRIHPTDGSVRFHYGVDIAAESGSKIKAFADGKVIDTQRSETLGKYVVVKHGSVETLYAHCSQIFASAGQAVEKGQEIAAVGMTGDATSPHLHFEMKVNGVYVNPEHYMQWT